MHRAEETLPPPSLRYTLAEQMNNKLIDYYEEENNPNTNDTVEDTIDELFGSIPLYHYLNAMFARTGAEFGDSLTKGLEGSFNAFMSLPYASSMMGDIAVVGPQMAFVPEPYVPQPEGVGKKKGKFIDNTTDAMTKGEKRVVDDLVGKGKTIERIPKSDVKTPDFKVDGVKTELKSLQNANTNTGMKRIQEGFKQGAETVIIDARGSGLTNSQATEIINRVSGKYSGGQLPGNVEIWLDGQIITYP